MTLPKPLGLPALTVGLLLTASTALAQSVPFDQVDDNNDGFLSAEELEGVLGSGPTVRLIERLDQDGDTLLSLNEVRAAADRDDGEDEDDDHEDDDDDEDDGEDNNRGHGNDEDGFDDDNPGRGHGDDGVPGGGRRNDNPGRGHGGNGGKND